MERSHFEFLLNPLACVWLADVCAEKARQRGTNESDTPVCRCCTTFTVFPVPVGPEASVLGCGEGVCFMGGGRKGSEGKVEATIKCSRSCERGR